MQQRRDYRERVEISLKGYGDDRSMRLKEGDTLTVEGMFTLTVDGPQGVTITRT